MADVIQSDADAEWGVPAGDAGGDRKPLTVPESEEVATAVTVVVTALGAAASIHPVIARSIRTARAADVAAEAIVVTDSPEIPQDSLSAGGDDPSHVQGGQGVGSDVDQSAATATAATSTASATVATASSTAVASAVASSENKEVVVDEEVVKDEESSQERRVAQVYLTADEPKVGGCVLIGTKTEDGPIAAVIEDVRMTYGKPTQILARCMNRPPWWVDYPSDDVVVVPRTIEQKW